MNNIHIQRGHYTIINNSVMQDKELSLKARGLLGLCLSLPDTWEYSIRGLAKIAGCSENAIQSGLRELERGGYLRRTRYRNEKGQLACDYIIYDEKQPAETLQSEAVQPGTEQDGTAQGEPGQENTCIKNQHRKCDKSVTPVLKNQTGKTRLENEYIINNINKVNKKKRITNRESIKYIQKGADLQGGYRTPTQIAVTVEKAKKQDEAFEAFWEAYPRHVSEPLAKIAFRALPVDDELYKKILDAVDRYKKTPQWQDAAYIPYPANFLQGERWEDDIPEPAQADGGYYDALMAAAEKSRAKYAAGNAKQDLAAAGL